MKKTEEVLQKAYGNVPKEVGFTSNIFDFLELRGVKYYLLRIKRFFTR
jgi:hypothetical protein